MAMIAKYKLVTIQFDELGMGDVFMYKWSLLALVLSLSNPMVKFV